MFIANVLQPLIDACQWVLEFWHGVIGDVPNSWGWSIILLTFTVRILILPLTFKGVKSMQRLQGLQPEIKKIQERFKDDKQRMNQEVMPSTSARRSTRSGPACRSCCRSCPSSRSSTCCAQMPSRTTSPPTRASTRSTTSPRRSPTRAARRALIVLYVGTQLASAVTAISADPMQRRIMSALPFVFVIFIIVLEAGLILYWITTNVDDRSSRS